MPLLCSHLHLQPKAHLCTGVPSALWSPEEAIYLMQLAGLTHTDSGPSRVPPTQVLLVSLQSGCSSTIPACFPHLHPKHHCDPATRPTSPSSPTFHSHLLPRGRPVCGHYHPVPPPCRVPPTRPTSPSTHTDTLTPTPNPIPCPKEKPGKQTDRVRELKP